jgi:hypothetical protein
MANYGTPAAFANVLTTELNSLADAANSAAGSAIDNSSNLYGFADLSMALAAINPTSAGARMEVHLLPRLADGSTYADISASTRVGTIVVDTTGSNTKEGMLHRVPVPPGFFKWAATNRTGVTLAASGSIFAHRLYDMKGA